MCVCVGGGGGNASRFLQGWQPTFTTMPLLPRVCLSVIGQNRSHDLKVSQCKNKDVRVVGEVAGATQSPHRRIYQ